MYTIGYCVTSHGYGHAARAAAVMESLAELVEVQFVIITAVPDWFFRDSLSSPYTIYPLNVDVGLVQHSALQIDLPATVQALQHFYGEEENISRYISSLLSHCDLMISDISPVAFSAARDVGIPSILLENFTWDWIYEDYLDSIPQIGSYIDRIRERYSLADYRIQAEPVCQLYEGNLKVAPIARKKRESRGEIRRKLRIDNDRHIVLISMGGEGIRQLPVQLLQNHPDTLFLVSGLKEANMELENLRVLREDSGLFHPDLVAAVDLVIGKVGYSTLAEVYHSGTPFGYVARDDFRETGPLVRFIEEYMYGNMIHPESFESGEWLEMLPGFFSMDIEHLERLNGADESADFIAALLR